MANETMTVNRLPALTWNWLKMNAARLEANAPAVGAAPSFVQTAQLARSSAAQDWAMETGMGTDVDRFLANSPAEYLTLGENEVMDAPRGYHLYLPARHPRRGPAVPGSQGWQHHAGGCDPAQ